LASRDRTIVTTSPAPIVTSTSHHGVFVPPSSEAIAMPQTMAATPAQTISLVMRRIQRR
jgi:hypothetical protein